MCPVSDIRRDKLYLIGVWPAAQLVVVLARSSRIFASLYIQQNMSA